MDMEEVPMLTPDSKPEQNDDKGLQTKSEIQQSSDLLQYETGETKPADDAAETLALDVDSSSSTPPYENVKMRGGRKPKTKRSRSHLASLKAEEKKKRQKLEQSPDVSSEDSFTPNINMPKDEYQNIEEARRSAFHAASANTEGPVGAAPGYGAVLASGLPSQSKGGPTVRRNVYAPLLDSDEGDNDNEIMAFMFGNNSCNPAGVTRESESYSNNSDFTP